MSEETATPRNSGLPDVRLVDVAGIVATTVRQPWAALIATGACPLVNLRAMRECMVAPYIAIHAGVEEDATADGHLAQLGIAPPEGPLVEVRGAVIAVARVSRVEVTAPGVAAALSPWARGPVVMWVEEATLIEPVRCTGSPDTWRLTDEVLAQVRPRYKHALDVARGLARASVVEAELDRGGSRSMGEVVLEEPRRTLAEEHLALLRVPVEAPPAPPESQPSSSPATSESEEDAELAVLHQRYEAIMKRARETADKYRVYERSKEAMDPVNGLLGYRCPICQQWFIWHPGCHPHDCAKPA